MDGMGALSPLGQLTPAAGGESITTSSTIKRLSGALPGGRLRGEPAGWPSIRVPPHRHRALGSGAL